MSEELDNQVPLVDEIDTKATSNIKNTNVRLKQTLNQVRSSHNFCIDIILLCIILGIVSYLYKKTEEYSVTKQSALNSGTQYYRGQGRTMPLNGAKYFFKENYYYLKHVLFVAYVVHEPRKPTMRFTYRKLVTNLQSYKQISVSAILLRLKSGSIVLLSTYSLSFSSEVSPFCMLKLLSIDETVRPFTPLEPFSEKGLKLFPSLLLLLLVNPTLGMVSMGVTD
ncbi:hypothetical protein F8388_003835 [Cannabis sativa]|uniref:t-SNARE coiled-coil homology domain-containing protein n=1 Tax=Cannabis sativa TaxID=3483 RepID=A0A7J6GP32_CANSA|nr:hypothetical protein F8388_003835 [Cannabis sativa]